MMRPNGASTPHVYWRGRVRSERRTAAYFWPCGGRVWSWRPARRRRWQL